MPFREKIAWISVVTTIMVWGGFFGTMAATGGKLPGQVYMMGFLGAVIVQAILAVAATIVITVQAPREATAGSDERDRIIGHRAYAVAYPVLLSLVICIAAGIHFGFNARIMGAIVIAEIVHYTAQIVGYRTGNG